LAALRPYVNLLAPSLQYVAIADFALVSAMYTIEFAYKSAFADGIDYGDGVVPLASQRWSGNTATLERTIYNADSHVGSTKSSLVRDQLQSLLLEANR
jgi:hypothetical protein